MSTPMMPYPPNYAFPFVPGKQRVPPDFKLWPEAFVPELRALTLPETPPIPPWVVTGEVITAVHENTVSMALNDLWINQQWIAANMLNDPTTATGQIIVRGPTGLVGLPVGSDGQILTSDSTQPNGVRWAPAAAGGVTSFNGRSGAVDPWAGDYTAAMVTNAVDASVAHADPTWISSLSWGKLTGVPISFPPAAHTHDAAAIVSGVIAPAHLGTGTASSSVFLRGDGVWAVPPTGGGGAAQTPWLSDIDAALYSLNRLSILRLSPPWQSDQPSNELGDIFWVDDMNTSANKTSAGIYVVTDATSTPGNRGTHMSFLTRPDNGAASSEYMRITSQGYVGIARGTGAFNTIPAYPLDVQGDVNVTGQYRVNGVPISTGGAAQTPWLSDIDGASHNLNNVARIGIGTASVSPFPLYVQSYGLNQDAVVISDNVGTSMTGFIAKNSQGGLYAALNVYGASHSSGAPYAGNAAVTSQTNLALVASGNYMILTSAGNVGVGIAAPAYKLDVSGDVNITGTYRVNGVPLATGGGAGNPAGTTGQVQFNAAGAFGASANLFWDQTNSRLGIGTSTPIGDVHVASVNVTSGTRGLTNAQYSASVHGALLSLIKARGTPSAPSVPSVNDYLGQINFGAFDGSGYSGGISLSGILTGSISGGIAVADFVVSTSGNERVRITSAGNVGIGTTSPGAQLHIGTAGSGAGTAERMRIAGKQFGYWRLESTDTTSTAGLGIGYSTVNPALFIQTDGIMAGHIGIGTYVPGALLDMQGGNLRLMGADSTSGDIEFCRTSDNWRVATISQIYDGGQYGSHLAFKLHPSDNIQATAPIERMRISSAGNVGIGITNPVYLLQLSADSAAKPGTSTWIIGSDSRLKQNSKLLVGGLSVIEQLRCIEAEYNGCDRTPAGMRVVGFNADEVRSVLPGAVTSHRGRLHPGDADEIELLDFNIHEVLIHLILAVQQLATRTR